MNGLGTAAIATAEGAYTVTYIACRVCGLDRPRLLGIRGNLEYSGASPLPPAEPHMVTNVVKCRNCGFVYTNPLILLPETDGPHGYRDAEEYRPYAENPRRALEQTLKTIERLIGRKGRLLDVGAGKGEFLAVAKRCGWEVQGLEPSEGLAAHASTTHHLPIWRTTLDDHAIPQASFDVVTLNMVLEHVDDPNGLLRAVHRVLVSDGILFIEVPNLESFMLEAIRMYFRIRKRDWSPLLSPLHWPFHCYGYSLHTIRFLCQRNGFDIVRATTGDLGPRGFRENLNIHRWEQQLRMTLMKLGGLVGRGDVLTVWCRKTNGGDSDLDAI